MIPVSVVCRPAGHKIATHILNLAFHILNNFSSFFPICWFFPLLVSHWLTFTVFVTKTVSSKSANISHVKVARHPPMRLHDKVVKSAALLSASRRRNSFLINSVMKKIVQHHGHHECGMLNKNVLSHLLIHICDGSSKFKWIQH
jgi:hypothetical protein